ncbi:MAG: DEAD/DEAH box helicase [Firmicutes bacterium]|nr:DEAD/DEAH box helicase [Alicyclobacillaceae bacterium]MCL6496752.1 DEAD/DEAH box helicase [Bacillota bacterium]
MSGTPEALCRRLKAWPYLEAWVAEGRLAMHPHQVEAALSVVERLGGSAILADEVGLGKTIETGLILAEMKARGQIANALILTPAGLVSQWRAELEHRFGFVASASPRESGWLWIFSLDAAKRSPLREQLQAVWWDVVVVDEAHHLKNAETQNYQLVAGLWRRHLLLLTATPMENRLTELYNLVNLVKPGAFGSYLRFYREFILAPRTPKSARHLRRLLGQVMVRNRRTDVGQPLPPRRVALWPVTLTAPERTLYDRLTAGLRQEYRRRVAAQQTWLPLMAMQRQLCSSPQALLPTLERQTWLGPEHPELVALARAIPRAAKVGQVVELARHFGGPLLVFSEFRASCRALAEALEEAAIPARVFDGGLGPRQRDALVDWFWTEGGVLVSTEAGGQGLNLQCCHRLVNFDLPWNPMRIEQRIGRIHRLGQSQPVEIVNLYAEATIEEDILHLLHEKIDLFRQVVGELDVILRHLERRGSFQARLIDIFLGEEDRARVEAALDRLGREFRAARQRMTWPSEEERPSRTAVPSGSGRR